jgi:ATP-dependent DNA ligase
MLAKRVGELPDGAGWIFEPKWDGFRVLVFRDGDELLLQSRDEKPLDRYFPELREPLAAQLPPRCVLDGELVVAKDGALDFEALQQRIHPAASRIALLAREIPASIVFWDLLCVGDRDLRGEPFRERRRVLEMRLAAAKPPLHLTLATEDRDTAADWFRRFEGAGVDGVMAKPASGTYQPNQRVMLKVKHERECDCVVAGFRWHKAGRQAPGPPGHQAGRQAPGPPGHQAGRQAPGPPGHEASEGGAVGSLLLGLYDASGALHHVGVAASFSDDRRRALVSYLAPYRRDALADHPWKGWASAGDPHAGGRRMPGAKSRWSQGKDLSWEPLRPELVVEVAYDHMQGMRFRHTAHFRRWRTDKRPRDCTYAQLEVVAPHEIAAIFAASAARSEPQASGDS